jgi:hypothetical protein
MVMDGVEWKGTLMLKRDGGVSALASQARRGLSGIGGGTSHSCHTCSGAVPNILLPLWARWRMASDDR